MSFKMKKTKTIPPELISWYGYAGYIFSSELPEQLYDLAAGRVKSFLCATPLCDTKKTLFTFVHPVRKSNDEIHSWVFDAEPIEGVFVSVTVVNDLPKR